MGLTPRTWFGIIERGIHFLHKWSGLKMARSIEALVKPEMLVWARESAGLPPQVAAKKIGIKSEKLEMWEKGEIRPTVAQLRKAASVYKRPTAAFYLPRPPAACIRRICRVGDKMTSSALARQ